MKKAFMNWSGGKDAAFSLYKLKDTAVDINYLLTTLSSQYHRVSMHGIREVLLEAQAHHINIPLKKVWLPEQASLEQYDNIIKNELTAMLQQNIRYAVFGDIFLDDLKRYREKQLEQIGMEGIFPLWKKDSVQLIHDFLSAGFKAIIVCVNTKYLDKSFAGKIIDKNFLNEIPPGVDPCGENGEFHTFVFDGPLFRQPVKFTIGEVIKRTYTEDKKNDSCHDAGTRQWDNEFYFCDLLPE